MLERVSKISSETNGQGHAPDMEVSGLFMIVETLAETLHHGMILNV